MGSTVKSSIGNGGTGGNGYHKGRPFALLLLAFGMAFLAVMVLHKFRERQVLAMVSAENDQQLIVLHSLLQTEQRRREKAKKKILQITERHRVERKELQSTISALKVEQEKLYNTLQEKNNEIKKLREQEQSHSSELSQVAALREILKQKEAEIKELKNREETLVKVWSVSGDDPSNPATNLTTTEFSVQNIDASQSREPGHSVNSTNGSQNESSADEDNLSINDETQTSEGVHSVQKMDVKGELGKSKDTGEISVIGGDGLEESNTNEAQGKEEGESQDQRDSTIAKNNSTKEEKTSSRETPALDAKQDGQAFEDVHKGGANSDKIDNSGTISRHRRHRRHRGKRWREYIRSRRMGRGDHTETKETDTAEKNNSTAVITQSQHNSTEENVQPNHETTQDRVHVEQTENKNETTAQETQLTVSGDSGEQRIETAGTGNNGENLTEAEHGTEKFANMSLSMKLQETQKQEEDTDQINVGATEQKDQPNTELQAINIAEKEHSEVNMPNKGSKQNFTDESKQLVEQKPESNSAKSDQLDANSGPQEIDAAAGNSVTQSKSNSDGVKNDLEEEEEPEF